MSGFKGGDCPILIKPSGHTDWGAWVAEQYHTWLWTLVHCAMPWAMSLSLGDNKLFFGPKHNIYAFFMILFGLFHLILLFACQICHVNCETENYK